MKLYDISQEVFSSAIYPGDPSPKRQILASLAKGDVCHLTAFSMCAHNGTHIDAPYHFLTDGKTVDQLPLSHMVGAATVISFEGTLGASEMKRLYEEALKRDPEAAKRLLIKGKATLSKEAADYLATAGIYLFGNESQTVGPEEAPMAVHLTLLGADVVLLEGIRLAEVPEGIYLLSAAPLLLGGADGAPCRAVLIRP